MLSLWGKTRLQEVQQWHPLAYHMLDVAACADVLWQDHASVLRARAARAGIAPHPLKKLCLYLIGMHDIGKAADSFQKLLNNPCSDYHVQTPLKGRHWQWSYGLFRGLLRTPVHAIIQGDTRSAATPLLAAVSAHHGTPLPRNSTLTIRESDLSPASAEQVLQLHHMLKDLFLGDDWNPAFPALSYELAEELSFFLAGFTTLADWIGSNEEWFAFCAPDISPVDYWQQAQGKAHHAVASAGLVKPQVKQVLSLEDLTGIKNSRPLQHAASTLDLSLETGPQLFILEDATGSGKTEAALVLAQKLLATKFGDGLYVALPTMATANAMFDRLEACYQKLFCDVASLSLAHGKAGCLTGLWRF